MTKQQITQKADEHMAAYRATRSEAHYLAALKLKLQAMGAE